MGGGGGGDQYPEDRKKGGKEGDGMRVSPHCVGVWTKLMTRCDGR